MTGHDILLHMLECCIKWITIFTPILFHNWKQAYMHIDMPSDAHVYVLIYYKYLSLSLSVMKIMYW